MAAMEGWEKVTLLVDSGASDTVVPPSFCKSAEMHATPKGFMKYECANRKPLYNLGERRCEAMLTKGGDVIGMAFQVVDVGTSLLSVSRVCVCVCVCVHKAILWCSVQRRGASFIWTEIPEERFHPGTQEEC